MSFVLPLKPGKQSVGACDVAADAVDNTLGKERLSSHKTSDTEIPHLDYQTPEWAAPFPDSYYLEVLRQGTIIKTDVIPRDKEFIVCGRLPTCDIPLEHSSISRQHAVVLFGKGKMASIEFCIYLLDEKVYLFDLDSTHGTFINKKRVPPRQFCEWATGSLVRFGESSRQYVLQSSDHIDGDNDEDVIVNDASSHSSKFPNPIATLRKWLQEFDEKLIFEKIVNDKDEKDVVLRVTIPPLTDSMDQGFSVEMLRPTRKEAEYAICLEICQRLLSLGELEGEEGNNEWEVWKRQKIEEQEDEEDFFLDQTPVNKRSKKIEPTVETIGSLTRTKLELFARIEELNDRIRELAKSLEQKNNQREDLEDELEIYMKKLDSQKSDEDLKILTCELEQAKAQLNKIETVLLRLGPESIHIDVDKRKPSRTSRNLSASKVTPKPQQIVSHDQLEAETENPPLDVQDKSRLQELKIKFGY